MKVHTLFGEEIFQYKKCRECGVEKPFTDFGYRNHTKNKPELLNTCRECKSIHDKIVRDFKKSNAKPDSHYKCPVCKETSEEIRSRGGFHSHQPKDVWCVDVCHDEMRVRGWICDYCNNMIGRSLDRPDVLREGALWIEQFKKEA